jgi:DNA-binding MarR family transcriptional regulator
MKKPNPPKDLWTQMDELVGPQQNDPGISAREFRERYHMGRTAADTHLRKLEKEGKLIRGRRRGADGRWSLVYRPK